jgi:hypothetical protein
MRACEKTMHIFVGWLHGLWESKHLVFVWDFGQGFWTRTLDVGCEMLCIS